MIVVLLRMDSQTQPEVKNVPEDKNVEFIRVDGRLWWKGRTPYYKFSFCENGFKDLVDDSRHQELYKFWADSQSCLTEKRLNEIFSISEGWRDLYEQIIIYMMSFHGAPGPDTADFMQTTFEFEGWYNTQGGEPLMGEAFVITISELIEIDRPQELYKIIAKNHQDIDFTEVQDISDFWRTIYLLFIASLQEPNLLTYENLPYIILNTSEDCSVCLNISNIITKCKHSFCFSCLEKWLKINNTCPLCRAQIQLSECSRTTESEYHKIINKMKHRQGPSGCRWKD